MQVGWGYHGLSDMYMLHKYSAIKHNYQALIDIHLSVKLICPGNINHKWYLRALYLT